MQTTYIYTLCLHNTNIRYHVDSPRQTMERLATFTFEVGWNEKSQAITRFNVYIICYIRLFFYFTFEAVARSDDGNSFLLNR